MSSVETSSVNTEQAAPKVESRALAKGLELLSALSEKATAMPLGQLAALIGLGKPSTLRLLQTLVTTGFVAKDAAGNYFAVASRAASAQETGIAELIEAARGEMERLNADLAETVSLAVLRDDHIRVVQTIESPHHIRMSNYPNRILAPYASSLGKAIAAWQTPEQLQVLLQVYGIYATTNRTITEPVLIREEMARIRERGYAHEYEESVLGGCCFAAPIRGNDDEPVKAAISVSLPTVRLTARNEQLIPDLLIKTAAQVAANLRRKST